MSLMDGMLALGKVDEVKDDIVAAILTQAWAQSQTRALSPTDIVDAYERIQEKL